MAKLHTDREVLRCIYDMYSREFPRGDLESGRVFIPIDVEKVAEKLGVDKDLLFGRLYYDLRMRHIYRSPNDPSQTESTLFEPVVGAQRQAVNFPYLTAVVAGLEEQRRRDLWTTGLAIVALVVSVATAVAQWNAPDKVDTAHETAIPSHGHPIPSQSSFAVRPIPSALAFSGGHRLPG